MENGRVKDADMTVALVNRFIPPSAAPTAAAMERLGRLLIAKSPALSLRMIGTDRSYVGGGAAGENLWRRAVASWRDGRRLAQKAAACDAVLSLTDPPLLRRHIQRALSAERLWIEWTMDAYPQALWAALGVRPTFRIPRPIGAASRTPDLFLRLGLQQATFLAAADRRSVPFLVLPAGVVDAPVSSAPFPAPSPRQPVRLAYAGNLGRAHWDEALLLLARACDPARFRLIIAAYGAHTSAMKAALSGFSHVEWREAPLSDAELSAIDAHVVSLRAHWTHICVPSKAISALARGRPILFFGEATSDVWRWADGAGWRVASDRMAATRDLPEILTQLATPERLAALTRRAQRAGDQLRQTEAATIDALAEMLEKRSTALNRPPRPPGLL